jgi:hypothetical protein
MIWEQWKIKNKVVVACLEVLSQHSPGKTVETRAESQPFSSSLQAYIVPAIQRDQHVELIWEEVGVSNFKPFIPALVWSDWQQIFSGFWGDTTRPA